MIPAFVFDNAATVVEIAFTRRTYFTLQQRPSDVEGAKRTVVLSQTHSSVCFFASQTRAARAPRKSRESSAHGRRAARVQKKDESEADLRFESTVGRDES